MALAEEQRPELRVGTLVLDRRRVVVTVAGDVASLSRAEFVLLAALMERPGEAVSRRELAEAVWGARRAAEGHAIDQSVYRLRRTLRRAAAGAGAPPPTIAPVRGFGYRLTAPGSLAAA